MDYRIFNDLSTHTRGMGQRKGGGGVGGSRSVVSPAFVDLLESCGLWTLSCDFAPHNL